MVKINLKDAYFTVPVWQNHQKFLRLVCLPALRAGKCSHSLHETCHSPVTTTGHQADSLFRRHACHGSIQRHCPPTCLNRYRSFTRVGLLESVLVPSTKMEFLGFMVDSISLSLALPRDKTRNVRRECQTLLDSPLVTVRQLAKLLGHLTSTSTIQAVFPGPLHFHHLQNKKNRALAHSHIYDSATPLSPQAKEELVWWRDNLEAWNGKALIWGSPDRCLPTRLGSILQRSVHRGSMVSRGISFPHKLSQTSGWGICFCERHRANASQLVNGQFYSHPLHKQDGGTKSPVLARLASELWEWCLHHNILIKAQYLPVVQNICADQESRPFLDHHNWKLDPLLFPELNQVWGPLEVDLFASQLSTQLPRFYSWMLFPRTGAK